MGPQERQSVALDQGALIHGAAYRREFENAFSVHWQRTRFSQGGWVLWPDRSPTSAYGVLLEPVERLYFAGDHLSYVTAWQHGAFESARYVVTRLHERVLAGPAGSR
jgi:monoamine oxidase